MASNRRSLFAVVGILAPVHVFALVQLFALLVASPAHAIDKCKVKIDAKTGVISVSASGVAGTLQWGSALGAEDNAFFNPSCVTDGTAKGCQLADPSTLAAKTPPEGCSIYLDDGTTPCSMWIKGCTPGQRSAPPDGALVWKDSNGAIVGGSDDSGTVLFRETGGTIVRMGVFGGSAFSAGGSFHYGSADCTGQLLVPGESGPIRNAHVPDSYGSVYYAPDGGTYQTDGSILLYDSAVFSPVDCLMYHPGSVFFDTGKCCQPLGGMEYLTIPATVDFTGVAFPIAPALQ